MNIKPRRLCSVKCCDGRLSNSSRYKLQDCPESVALEQPHNTPICQYTLRRLVPHMLYRSAAKLQPTQSLLFEIDSQACLLSVFSLSRQRHARPQQSRRLPPSHAAHSTARSSPEAVNDALVSEDLPSGRLTVHCGCRYTTR